MRASSITLARLGAALAVLLVPARAPSAQQPGATVRGTVTDSATGRPVVGARVSAQCPGCLGRHATDSVGRYALEAAPGSFVLEFHCPSRTLLGRRLARREVTVAPGAEAVVDVRVGPGACYEPPYAERSGVFRGHYTPGFESSRFVPCPDSAVGLAGGLLPGERLFTPAAWAEYAPAAARARDVTWPSGAPRDRWGNPTYFVVWRGTLRGPGQYGHLGVSEFGFTVDSVLSVRAAGRDDCAAR
jgi:hypothetical protein